MKKIIVALLVVVFQVSYCQTALWGVVEYIIEPQESFNPSGINDNKNIGPNEKKQLIEILSQPASFIMEFTSTSHNIKARI